MLGISHIGERIIDWHISSIKVEFVTLDEKLQLEWMMLGTHLCLCLEVALYQRDATHKSEIQLEEKILQAHCLIFSIVLK